MYDYRLLESIPFGGELTRNMLLFTKLLQFCGDDVQEKAKKKSGYSSKGKEEMLALVKHSASTPLNEDPNIRNKKLAHFWRYPIRCNGQSKH